MKHDARGSQATHLVSSTRVRNAFKWDGSSIWELDQRLDVRNLHKLQSRDGEAWRSSAGAERLLRTETFCERGARGEQKFWLRGKSACIGGLAPNWPASPQLGSFHESAHLHIGCSRVITKEMGSAVDALTTSRLQDPFQTCSTIGASTQGASLCLLPNDAASRRGPGEV